MVAEDQSLQNHFLYLECITIVLTAVTQLGWVLNVIKFHWFVGLSFALLLAAIPLSFIKPKSTRWRFLHLLAQTTVITFACALGPPRRYTIYFLVLGAKTAALLPRAQMLFVLASLLVSRMLAGAFSEYLTRHVYIHRAFVSDFYNSVIVETESKLYVIIGLITILFLGRKVVSERRSRQTQQSLAREAERLAIEFERDKIAGEIHDSLGHTLASLMIQLEVVGKLIDENKLDKAKDLAVASHDSAVFCLQELRRAVTSIRKDG
jgi:signal transduction histidine kinase